MPKKMKKWICTIVCSLMAFACTMTTMAATRGYTVNHTDTYNGVVVTGQVQCSSSTKCWALASNQVEKDAWVELHPYITSSSTTAVYDVGPYTKKDVGSAYTSYTTYSNMVLDRAKAYFSGGSCVDKFNLTAYP